MSTPNEEPFDSTICDWLGASGGYREVKDGRNEGGSGDFDPVRGLDTVELFAFLHATQAEGLAELIKRHGGDPEVGQGRFADRVANELDSRGVVDVLRRGVLDQGIALRLAYFKPARAVDPDLVGRYEANRITVTRHLCYEPKSTRSVALALAVNGIMVATAEVKDPESGRGVDDAIGLYRDDRDPWNRTLARAVVHFAIDRQQVAMTTALVGAKTRFLPFGPDPAQRSTTPPEGSATAAAFLWERVWQADAWLDLLGRFAYVEKRAKGSETSGSVIFPRFHQWEAVTRLEAAARDDGAGHSYLVEHSAGAGKSDTIGWLAHHLASLHADGEKLFDKVVVITDRVVVDRRLKDTVYQYEHPHGVVVRVDEAPARLAEALSGQWARIIITASRNLPFVVSEVDELSGARYAVIVDEVAEELTRTVRSRGHDAKLSYFAFTAAADNETLDRFGRFDPESDSNVPFHRYLRRPAIE